MNIRDTIRKELGYKERVSISEGTTWRHKYDGSILKIEAVGRNDGTPYSDFVVVSRDGKISVTDVGTLVFTHEEL